MTHSSREASTASLALGAIGVVFGDIGTSPLYTMKEVFAGHHPLVPSEANVLGVLSLVFWALTIVVSIKYVAFIMRADNNGEGGIMALIAMVQRAVPATTRLGWLLVALGIFGASLFYGDSIITPAISVLSAVEGLQVATPAMRPLVEPIALIVLIFLFAIQRRGTHHVGRFFGPVMALWFITLAVLGIANILTVPKVLTALNPIHALDFFVQHQGYAFLTLGAVVLAVTGAEALYADMGHFGRFPIRLAWFGLVLPALLLNYFGQGALLIRDPEAIRNPFYLQAPDWALYPLIGLATAATIIASQAVITGAFSVTRQAIQLGYLPRMQTVHTSEHAIGQIYIPFTNWAMLIGIVVLVLMFGSSSNLAAAYGIAVTGTMLIDTILGFVVVITLWRWNRWLAVAGLLVFLSVDVGFFAATSLKIVEGGWFPLMVGVMVFTLLSTWKRGRQLLLSRLQSGAIALRPFIEGLVAHPPVRVPGTAVFLTASKDGVPHALLHNLAHNKVLHERVVFLTVTTENHPYVPPEKRVEIEDLGHDFYRLVIHYGFKDEPDIPAALALCADKGLKFEMMETSFFLSRETIIATAMPGMAPWREQLFIHMARNAESAMAFFRIPTNRVIELGSQVEI
ncbi:potassium transporter Kup [Thiobacter aerophilum]|uniref:Probable potassium transport system protein Kup n=1 Tax=Thiobacter aerophilum TaxID=3121275 RepID=A0ABV0EBN6_9BURK